MGKKRTRVPKSGPVWRQSSVEATLAKMPRYNAHACGTGPQGDMAYNRARSKRGWKNDPDIKGACNRRLPLFSDGDAPCGNQRFARQSPRSSSIVSTRYVGCSASRTSREPMPQVTAMVTHPAALPACTSKMLSPTYAQRSGS